MDVLGLTLNTFEDGGTDYVVVQTCVNGNSLVSFRTYATDLDALIKSVEEKGEFFILTCWCGSPGCAGIGHGIRVFHEAGRIHWHVPEPLPPRDFVFSREGIQSALTALRKDIKRFVAERTYSNNIPYEVTPMDNKAYFNLG